jgi:hypothetical protein
MKITFIVIEYILLGIGWLWLCADQRRRNDGETPEELRELFQTQPWFIAFILLIWPLGAIWQLGNILFTGFGELIVWLTHGTQK